MKKYLLALGGATLSLLMLAAAGNFLVDPYRVHGRVDKTGFNHVKPHAGAHAKVAKAYAVVRVAPRSLILGNSRAEVGFNPQHPRWPLDAKPVFNLALPGTGTSTALSYLQHALVAKNIQSRPQLVVLGLDFIDFLPDVPGQRRLVGELPNSPWTAALNRENADLRSLKHWTESLLSLSALLDSFSTVAAQRDPFAQDLTAHGFNPMRDYERIAKQEGYRSLFRQKNRSYMRSLSKRAEAVDSRAIARRAAFQDVEHIIELCRREGIDLRFVLYPYHAHFMEAIRLTGLWPEFESWKLDLVDLASRSRSATGKALPVWDFSHYSAWTTEAVPPQGDKRSVVQWYWEAGHFKKDLGDLVLDRVLGADPPDDDFGLRLTKSNVQQIVLRDRAQSEAYSHEHPQETLELRAMLLP